MNLVLTLSNPELLPDTHRTRQVEFGPSGGTIGRADSCDWILEDPERFVSSRHVKISFKRGVFSIEDTSTNGTYLNDGLVGKGNRAPLKTGDVLRIGRFILSTSLYDDDGKVIGGIEANSEMSLLSDGPVNADDLLAEEGATASIDEYLENSPRPTRNPGADPFDVSDSLSQETGMADALPTLMQREHNSAIPQDWNTDPSDEEFTPRKSDASDEESPKLDPLADMSQASKSFGTVHAEQPAALKAKSKAKPKAKAKAKPKAKPKTRAKTKTKEADRKAAMPMTAAVTEPVVDSQPIRPQVVQRLDTKAQIAPQLTEANSFSEAFLDVFSLPHEIATPEHGALLGHVMKELLNGTIDLLNARADVRDELRLGKARVDAKENNPLKFSINAQDAALRLIKGQTMGFMEPISATEEALRELREHHFALLAGIDAGIKAVLNEMDPKNTMNSKGVLGIPTLVNRLSERHAAIAEDAIERSGGVFWRAFSNMYKASIKSSRDAT